MRKFGYNTIGTLMQKLKDSGLDVERRTIYKLEEDGLFVSKRSTGRWRVFSDEDAEIITKLILENYAKREFV